MLKHVVPEVHHEVVVTEELACQEHTMGEPERIGLVDVGHLDAEPRTVAERGFDLGRRITNDDTNVLYPGVRDLFDDVEQDRLVGDGHELLRTRMRQRTEARTGAAREDQTLHLETCTTDSGQHATVRRAFCSE